MFPIVLPGDSLLFPIVTLAFVPQWTHEVGAWLLGATILTHWTITARHARAHRDRYVRRMLPFTHQR